MRSDSGMQMEWINTLRYGSSIFPRIYPSMLMHSKKGCQQSCLRTKVGTSGLARKIDLSLESMNWRERARLVLNIIAERIKKKTADLTVADIRMHASWRL